MNFLKHRTARHCEGGTTEAIHNPKDCFASLAMTGHTKFVEAERLELKVHSFN